ncbi:MAG: polysaccharide deacetylase family protein [Firmicutes bacterium]|nr:polysaccharide deacetylase family protein [Bacillota bacterium]
MDKLNEIYDANFYSMLMYGGDMYDIRKTAEYILNNYEAKHIVINLGLEEAIEYNTETDGMKGNLHCKVDGSNALLFYGKYLFANPSYGYQKIVSRFQDGYVQNAGDVFMAENGTYDKSRRDAEHISDTASYLSVNQEAFYDLSGIGQQPLTNADQCVADIAAIKALCEAKGATFTLIFDLVYDVELATYDVDDLKQYWADVAEVTDYWNFSGYTVLSGDVRYFYDNFHYRTAVGDLILDTVKNGEGHSPFGEELGCYITKANADEAIAQLLTPKNTDPAAYTTTVPILMYHSVSDNINSVTVSPERFEEQLVALKAAGYETVSFEDLIRYVEHGTPLPAKPIVITFDDGYRDNYTEAYPILQKHGMKATIAVIGSSVGKDTYGDTDIAILPHFSYDEAKEMAESGVIEIATHGYDVHQWKDYEEGECRYSAAARFENESEEDYIAFFRNDYRTALGEIETALGYHVTTYAYPNGDLNELTEILLMEMGNQVSLGGGYAHNEVLIGLPQSLRAMHRYSINQDYSAEQLIRLLEGE